MTAACYGLMLLRFSRQYPPKAQAVAELRALVAFSTETRPKLTRNK
jgi:hypothetical protein